MLSVFVMHAMNKIGIIILCGHNINKCVLALKISVVRCSLVNLPLVMHCLHGWDKGVVL